MSSSMGQPLRQGAEKQSMRGTFLSVLRLGMGYMGFW